MRKLTSLALLFTLAATFAFAQDGFTPAKVAAIERAANSEQHAEKADNYKISMRLGDTIYNCVVNAPVQTFMDWTTTKSFPAKLSADGKTLSVKVTSGEIIDMKVKGKKKVG